MGDKFISSEEWEKNPFRSAGLYESLQESGELEPGFTERILRKIRGRKLTDQEKEALEPFLSFLEKEDYHSAGVIADAILDDSPYQVEKGVETLVDQILGEEPNMREVKEGFALLDSFNQGKRLSKVEGEYSYIDKDGMRLIDELATEIWSDLDGTSRAFFEMYVEEESDAVITTEKGEKLALGAYRDTASEAYEEVLKEDPGMALNIVRRFELGQDKVLRAETLQRIEETVAKLKEGEAGELSEADLQLLKKENVNLAQFNAGNRFQEQIGNFLTDRHLWRTNPEQARRAGGEDIAERIEMMQDGRRGSKPGHSEKQDFFEDLMDRGEFHAASIYADTAQLEPEEVLEENIFQLLKDENYREAFAAMDAFDYDKKTSELIEEGRSSFYLVKAGPRRLIDKTATQIWRDLDGSARAFFQMYIDDPEERPEDSFTEETIAAVYHPTTGRKRKDNYHREDAFTAYEQALQTDQQQAEQILERFGIELQEN